MSEENPNIELIREINELWDASQEAQGRLTSWQKGFIKDQIDRYHQYGDGTRFSPKQIVKMRECYETMQGL